MTANQTIGLEAVHGFLSNPFDGDLHAERVLSLANATLGVIRTASLAVNTIGQGLAFGARPDDQARDQASGPAVVQRRLMLRCATGFPMCRAPASTWRWTGPLWRTLGHCGLRDTKDLRFGMGMESIHVSTPAGRDRLWLLNALAIALLTLLGAPGEALGYDRHLKSNTGKRRTQSLFRQGSMLYDLIPTMPEPRLLPLVERFAAMLAEIPIFAGTVGVVSE